VVAAGTVLVGVAVGVPVAGTPPCPKNTSSTYATAGCEVLAFVTVRSTWLTRTAVPGAVVTADTSVHSPDVMRALAANSGPTMTPLASKNCVIANITSTGIAVLLGTRAQKLSVYGWPPCTAYGPT
jgi:hypothetical protein